MTLAQHGSKWILIGILVSSTLCVQNSMICHSHDDLGWLKTIDQYYTDAVRNIFNSVLDSLEASDPGSPTKRKFVYSETGFLKMYIEEEPEKRQAKIDRIKRLIKRGQWEFVNGGMSQSDEASPHFEDIIDNYYAGLRYLKKNFQATSNTCWQLDPFGHSKTLHFIAAKFGMKHSVFSRLPGKVFNEWEKQQKLDYLWKFPDGTHIVVHAHAGYYPPESLGCFDSECDITKFNQAQFTNDCRIFDRRYRQNSLFTVGGDFHYQHAQKKFDFLDHVISKNPNTNYALMSEFASEFDKRYPTDKLPVFEDDLFVYQEYVSKGVDDWSGYFTTHPRLKRRIKRVGLMLRSVKALIGIAYSKYGQDENDRKQLLKMITEANEEFGIFMHHDSITGTSVEKVYDDYMKLLSKLEKQIEDIWGFLADVEVEVLDTEELIAGTKTKFMFHEELKSKGKSTLAFINPSASIAEKQISIPIPFEFKDYSFSLKSSNGAPIDFSLTFLEFSNSVK